jgi:hypothetical protein
MSALGFVQLLVDVAFLFMILLLFVGRVWKRGKAANEEHESYREMISSLTMLIREMKETAADLEERGARKQLELQRAVGAADERLEALHAAVSAPLPVGIPPAAAGRTAEPPAAPVSAAGSGAAAVPPPIRRGGTEPAADDEDERREKYRMALDFARKGWNILEIARHTRLPRGEVELLIKTRGGHLGGGA